MSSGVRMPLEIEEYIKQIAVGQKIRQTVKMVNEKFGTSYNYGAIKTKIYTLGIRSGVREKKVFKEEYTEYIREIAPGRTKQQISDMLYEKFGARLTVQQLKNHMITQKITSGVDCKFKKGQESPTRGKNISKIPVGTIRQYDAGNYVKIEPGKHETLGRYIWKKEKGPIPKGMVVRYKDNNPNNVDIENLYLVDKRVSGLMNKQGIYKQGREYIDTALLVAELTMTMNRKKRGG